MVDMEEFELYKNLKKPEDIKNAINLILELRTLKKDLEKKRNIKKYKPRSKNFIK